MLVLPAKPPDLLGHLLGVRSGRVLAPLTRGWTSSCAPPEQSLLPAPQAVGRDPEIFGDPLEGSTAADVEIDGLSPELFRIRWFGFGHVRIPFSDCALSVHRFGGSSEQVNALINTPLTSTPEGQRDRAILELLYSSGLRAGELCKLTIYDLDRDKRTLRVTQAKGRKDRVVPVGVFALESIAFYLDKARAALNTRAKPGRAGARLFLTDQGAAFTTAKLARLVKRHAKQAALPQAFTTHSLRHACATGMLRGGASIRHV